MIDFFYQLSFSCYFLSWDFNMKPAFTFYAHFVFLTGLVDFFPPLHFPNLKVSFLAGGTNFLLYGSNTHKKCWKVPFMIMQQFYHLWTYKKQKQKKISSHILCLLLVYCLLKQCRTHQRANSLGFSHITAMICYFLLILEVVFRDILFLENIWLDRNLLYRNSHQYYRF